MKPTLIYTTESCEGYELIDSGNGSKYERFGAYTLVRPDPQALWTPALSREEWSRADGTFAKSGKATGSWHMSSKVPREWTISLEHLSFVIKPSAFKHTGIFPEHAPHWKWMQETIRSAGRPISVLNLFAYTGGATLACAEAGAEVCHVDGSKVAIAWAKKNAEASGLAQAPIRWITDDVLAFVRREIKRGRKYDAVIMDPPAFGRGAKGEVWKLEDSCMELLGLVLQVLSDKPLFVLMNGYASGYSPIGYENALVSVFPNAMVERGELTIRDKSGRLLPAGIFARATFVEKSQNTSILNRP